MAQPEITLHVIDASPPCHTAEAALAVKGLAFERIVLPIGKHRTLMPEIYGDGNRTVPGMIIDGEQVHGSEAILRHLETVVPEPALYPAAVRDQVRSVAGWAERTFQNLGRHLFWGALRFRPEALGTMVAGGSVLDPAGTDFAMKFIQATWKEFGITAVMIASELESLVAGLDRIDGLVADGIAGGEQPTAVDLHVGPILQLLYSVGDVRPLIDARPWAARVRGRFPEQAGLIPAGAFPAGWVPAA